ncbi:MAG TPA: hypothetical protein VKH37_07010, partial [Ferruginibacter sp.]|nr:hypothetical protein [Ferruginibacter sp.]
KGHKAELVGKETLDNNECYKIKLTTNANKEIFYWINTSTNLIYQMSQKVGGMGGGEREIISVYSDYKPVDGIQFAFAAELKGGFGGKMNFEKIEINKPVNEKLYKPE